ncbi:ABC transporter permease [Bacteroidota bacterium]
MKNPKPPKRAKQIIKLFSNRDEVSSIIHNFEEEFDEIAQSKGVNSARLWYWKQILCSLPQLIKSSFLWGGIMFKSYFTSALRNIKKYKGYSFINIIGLAVGLTCSLLIFLFVTHELSYDGYHEKSDQIYRLNFTGTFGGSKVDFAAVAAPSAEAVVRDYPEIETAVRLYLKDTWYVRYQEKSFKETRISFADETLFDVFSIPLLHGEKQTALANPNTIVISESTAQKYFGNLNPIGETLILNGNANYSITGVYEDIPGNSHFHYDFFASLSSLDASHDTRWLNHMKFFTYVVLSDDADPVNVQDKLSALLTKYVTPGYGLTEEETAEFAYLLQPLTDIHLYSHMYEELELNGDISYIYIFSAIAVFILILAAVNFINLSTARSSNRAKEVGIRKTLGSFRSQIVKQFLAESTVFSFLALFIAIIFVYLFLPSFNELVSRQMSILYLLNIDVIITVLGITLLLGLFSGIYPSVFLSSFQPVKVLSQKFSRGAKGKRMRNFLIIFQFVISICLIIGTIVVKQQLEYIQNKELGFNKEQVLLIHDTNILGPNTTAFKEQLIGNTQIISASYSGFLPVESVRSLDVMCPEGIYRERGTGMQKWFVDDQYINTMGMEIAAGRNFSKEFQTDSIAVIVNEAAVSYFGWENPIGKYIYEERPGGDDPRKYQVVGVVKDFHFESLRENISPVGFFAYLQSRNLLSVRLNTENLQNTIEYINNSWRELTAGQPFEFSFLDDKFDAMYKDETKLSSAFGIFSGLAIFIGCLGLFGLVSFVVEHRKKEVGIRKVMGASVGNVFYLITKEMIGLILIAIFIASPVSYYFMNSWLNDFAYKTEITIWIFILAGLSALLLTLLTVSYQVIKAARANPVDTIKYE